MFDLPLDVAISQLRTRIRETTVAVEQTLAEAMIYFSCPGDLQKAVVRLNQHASGDARREISAKLPLITNLLGKREDNVAPTPENNVELFLEQGNIIGKRYKQQLEILEVLHHRLITLENHDENKENFVPRAAAGQ